MQCLLLVCHIISRVTCARYSCTDYARGCLWQVVCIGRWPNMRSTHARCCARPVHTAIHACSCWIIMKQALMPEVHSWRDIGAHTCQPTACQLTCIAPFTVQ